jgi:glycosyltransferase involved in cell wall biosynthesis
MILHWDSRVQQTLDCLLSERSFDLIAIEMAESGMYHFQTETPTIFTEHEVRHPRPVDWRGWAKQNWMQWALREADWQRWGWYQRQVWCRFDRIQTFTPHDAAGIGRIAPEVAERVRVNPFGMEMPPLADRSCEEPHTLVFVGSFGHAPNVDAALWLGHDIMPLLRTRCPGVRLLIIGSMPPPSVQALATTDVTVTGYVPKVEPYLERAAVIVAPVRTGGGQRVKVLQGMAMGKALVTTPLGAQGLDIAGHRPPLIVAQDAEDIASATAALLTDDEARWALGRQARAFVVEHFSPSAYARRIETIYNELQPVETLTDNTDHEYVALTGEE